MGFIVAATRGSVKRSRMTVLVAEGSSGELLRQGLDGRGRIPFRPVVDEHVGRLALGHRLTH